VQRDTNKNSLRAAISSIRYEQLNYLIRRNEDVVESGNGLEEAGSREIKGPFIGRAYEGQQAQHV